MTAAVEDLSEAIGAGDADRVRQVLFEHVYDNGGEDSRGTIPPATHASAGS
jgi:hypothetical protein